MPKRTLDVSTLHPIRLATVVYPKVFFELTQMTAQNSDGPLVFPEIKVEFESSVLDDVGYLILYVKSVPSEEKQEILNFNVVVAAQFKPYSGGEEYLENFMDSETPARIVWPYLRNLIAEMTRKMGLPSYHLPMTQILTGDQNVDGISLDSLVEGNKD